MRPEPQSRENQGPRINDQIRAREVRLIDENGQNVGVIAKFDALARAEGVGLDLVEISPVAETQVFKILGLGQYKFQGRK
jgi:translation initiation factor IF-3